MTSILVVEDNPADLRLAAAILRADQHEVILARNAREAERVVDRIRPDLVVLDLGLPGKDGLALAKELRGRPRTAHLPILAVTSYVREEDERAALEAGCDDYLRKPIDRSAFLERVRSLLELRSGR